MRKVFFLCMFFLNFLYAVNVDDVKNWDDLGQYNRICTESVRDLFIEKQSDSLANLYAKACLKMDKVNELAVPIVMLFKNKEARENAAFYSTILFQKKMLYLALLDGVDISNIRTPKVDYILSDIFDKFVHKKFIKSSDRFTFITDYGQKCDLAIKDDQGIKKMVLLLYNKENKIDSIKMYW